MLERAIGNKADVGLFFLRLTLAVVFITHGSQKITTLFGGGGFSATAEQFSSIGIYFPRLMAYIVGLGEMISGILFLFGLFTREAALFMIAIMIGAVITVHGQNGFFITQSGYEYNFVIIGSCLCLLLGGGGIASVDRILFPRERWTFVKDPSKIRLAPPSSYSD